jgi:hypothetical protein
MHHPIETPESLRGRRSLPAKQQGPILVGARQFYIRKARFEMIAPGTGT